MPENETIQEPLKTEGQGAEGQPEDISWDNVAEDLEEQRQINNEEAAKLQDEQKPLANGAGKRRPTQQFAPPNLDFVLDIPLEVTVELGRAKMPIYDLLQLGQGSIVELNKLAGEPLEILVNQKLIAKGEVVVVNEKFGIRLTDVISPMERIEKLG
jgi:flagellar motor switch protein FliN/FliY